VDILEIRHLTVRMGSRAILDDLSLTLKAGQVYVLFGPNGSGKTTVINAIMGILPPESVSGQILFDGIDITGKSVDERSRLGLFVGFQNPTEITGIKLADLLKLCLGQGLSYKFSEEERRLIETFNLTDFLDRDINMGFSGGEKKRAEVLQMIFVKPRLMLLDEPDSGVDVESLKLIASEIQRYLQETQSSALIVTHKGDILEYIKSKHGCILLGGKFHCFAGAKNIYHDIKEKGYEECVVCRERVSRREKT
jgi:Fe-S cluster assembly ATP-binding protein